MKLVRPPRPILWPRAAEIGGATLSLAVAVALYTRFGLDDTLKRDEAIYVYAGQQLTHGVAPYASIFDPKTPLASMLVALGIGIGNLVGANDLDAARILFFGFAVGTVLAVYLLALRLWRSVVAAVVAAAVFAAFRGFAMDALAGPNAKTPGIFFAVLAMALAVRKRWFWAAFTGSLAFLVWQPLGVYAAAAVAYAAVGAEAGHRRQALVRSVAGAAGPVVVVAAYFGVVGAFGKLVEAAFVFPAVGIKRGAESEVSRLAHIVSVVRSGYSHSGWLFWIGTVLFLLLVVVHLLGGRRELRVTVTQPLIVVVLTTFVVLTALSASDFQGYPDLYPLLPYAAIGLGGAAGLVLDRLREPVLRTGVTAGALAAVLALTALSTWWFSHDRAADNGLVAQRSDACVLGRVVGADPLVALGDPTPLVLTHRRNPNRFIYLNSGVASWHIDHTPGGLAGWKGQIRSYRPAAIVVNGWKSSLAPTMLAWLGSTYDASRLGPWRVFLGPGVRDRAASTPLAGC